jgi:hypothetical protein
MLILLIHEGLKNGENVVFIVLKENLEGDLLVLILFGFWI